MGAIVPNPRERFKGNRPPNPLAGFVARGTIQAMSDPTTRDQLEAIAARRMARRDVSPTDDEAQELANAQAIDAAEEKYETIVGKGLRVLEAPDGTVVIVKKPANATYRKFQDSKEKPEDASRAFVKPCVVYPEAAAYVALLDEYPGLLVRLVKACAKLAGYADEEK